MVIRANASRFRRIEPMPIRRLALARPDLVKPWTALREPRLRHPFVGTAVPSCCSQECLRYLPALHRHHRRVHLLCHLHTQTGWRVSERAVSAGGDAALRAPPSFDSSPRATSWTSCRSPPSSLRGIGEACRSERAQACKTPRKSVRRGGAEGEEEREGLLSGFIIVGRAWTTQWMLARNHTVCGCWPGTTHARRPEGFRSG